MSVPDFFKWHDPKTNEARDLLERVLNDVHWSSSQRYHKRKIVQAYTRRIILLGSIAAVLFVGVLVLSGVYQTKFLIFSPFSGVPIVILAGILGACFSVLINSDARDVSASIEELLRMTSFGASALRVSIGGFAAVILYFFFEAGLVDGMLFPDLTQLGFSTIAAGLPSAEQLEFLLQDIRTEGLVAVGHAGDVVARLATIEASEGDATKLGEIRSAAGEQLRLITEIAQKAVLPATTTDADPARKLAAVFPELRASAERALWIASKLANEEMVATLSSTDQQRLIELLEAIRTAAKEPHGQRFGTMVPNADLSKLMVWSFLAGFSEQFVAQMLRRVEANGQQGGTQDQQRDKDKE